MATSFKPQFPLTIIFVYSDLQVPLLILFGRSGKIIEERLHFLTFFKGHIVIVGSIRPYRAHRASRPHRTSSLTHPHRSTI